FVHHNIEMAVAFTSSNQWTISRDGQVLSKHHTDLVSRVYVTLGIDLEVKDADSLVPPVRGVLFPFWHDKNDPPMWVWGRQSTMRFRGPLAAMLLPSSPQDGGGFRTCSDFYIVRFGQLIGGSFVFREALGCYRRHGANNFSRNGLIAARMQTGDMRRHPALAAYRALVLSVLSERKETWLAGLRQDRYADLVGSIGALPDEASARPPLHRRLVRGALVRMLGEPAYVRLRLSLGKLIG